jgi:tetratricopeptide (TPR) repeat protein
VAAGGARAAAGDAGDRIPQPHTRETRCQKPVVSHNPRQRAQKLLARTRVRNDVSALGIALAEQVEWLERNDGCMAGFRAKPSPDWRILSLQGAVLDQMGRHEEAQRYYGTALRIVPEEPSVMSNLGLSYALSKDLVRAETTLRQAAGHSRVDRRLQQNRIAVVAAFAACADPYPPVAAMTATGRRTRSAARAGSRSI